MLNSGLGLVIGWVMLMLLTMVPLTMVVELGPDHVVNCDWELARMGLGAKLDHASPQSIQVNLGWEWVLAG